MQDKAKVTNGDKPFILALISALLLVLCILGGFMGYDFAESAFPPIISLISVAWTFYFTGAKEKNGQTKAEEKAAAR